MSGNGFDDWVGCGYGSGGGMGGRTSTGWENGTSTAYGCLIALVHLHGGMPLGAWAVPGAWGRGGGAEGRTGYHGSFYVVVGPLR